MVTAALRPLGLLTPSASTLTWEQVIDYTVPAVLTSVVEVHVARAHVLAAYRHEDAEVGRSIYTTLTQRVLEAVVAGHPEAREMAAEALRQ